MLKGVSSDCVELMNNHSFSLETVYYPSYLTITMFLIRKKKNLNTLSSSQGTVKFGEDEVSLGEAWAVRLSVLDGCHWCCYGRGWLSASAASAGPAMGPGLSPDTAMKAALWAGCYRIKGPSINPWSSQSSRRGTIRASAPDTSSTGETEGETACVR